MSRLKPFYGGMTPPAVGGGYSGVGVGAPQQMKHLQALEQDTEGMIETMNFVPKESIDASIQGGDAMAGSVLTWHPELPVLAVATNVSIVEYDAISGSRRNMVDCQGSPVKLQYSASGEYIVLLTRERNIFAWSTVNWKKVSLLIAPSKYADRPLVSGLMAVSCGPTPVVYYSPIGKKTIRTVHVKLPEMSSGEKREKELMPGFKLKTDNKKALVGLASSHIDPSIVFALTVEGELMMCRVADTAFVPLSHCDVPFVATQERVRLHARAHPVDPKHTMLLVEAERSGITIVEANSMGQLFVNRTLKIGTGGVLAGIGVVSSHSSLVAAVRQARGNVGFFAWKMLVGGRGVTFAQCNAMPNSLWGALQGDSGHGRSQNIADVSGDSMVAGMVVHGGTGMMAFRTTNSDQTGVSHFRIPLMMLVDGSEAAGGFGAPGAIPMHSAPDFWIHGASVHDKVVSELFFPKSIHIFTHQSILGYEITHGLLSVHMTPALKKSGQEQIISKVYHSNKKALWLVIAKSVEPCALQDGTTELSGTYRFSAVPDKDVAISPGSWWFPGRDGTFVGSRDELAVVLSNSGRSLAVFDSAKLAQHGVKSLLYLTSFEEGIITRIFRGPPSRIPGAPKPRPEIVEQEDDETDDEAESLLQEWEAHEAKRLELPKRILILSNRNRLCLVDVSQSGSIYHQASKALATKFSCQLPLNSSVVQVAWQSIIPPSNDFHLESPGAESALPCFLAVLLTDRVLLLSQDLDIIATSFVPSDSGSPTSCLWIGPSLLVSTSANQLFYVLFDGSTLHAASLMMGPPVVLLGATGDRIMLSYTGRTGPEACSRAWDPMPMMLLGWALLSSKGFLPGGHERANLAMKALLSSYDATKIPILILDRIASLGFPDLSAAASGSSEIEEMSESRQAVMKAAAGEWEPVVNLVLSEYEESEYYPEHPSKDSNLYRKLVTLARACQLHGRFNHARSLLEAAGAWGELFSLCVFQGDFSGLQHYASRGGPEAQMLASHLLSVNEDAFRRSVSSSNPRFHGRPYTDDWDIVDVECLPTLDEAKEQEEDLEPESPTDVARGLDAFDLAPSDRMPFMEATLQVDADAIASGKIQIREKEGEEENEEAEGDPIGNLDRTKLESYLGFSGAAVRPSAILGDTGPEKIIEELDEDLDFNDDASSEYGAVKRVITGEAGALSETATETSASESMVSREQQKESAAQASARASFTGKIKADSEEDDFFSSDDDESSAAGGGSSASFAAETTNKFMFSIKSQDDIRGVDHDIDTLKTAAQSLKLGSVTKSSFKRQLSVKESDLEKQLSKTSSQSSMDQTVSSLSTMQLGDTGQPSKLESMDPFAHFPGLPKKIGASKSEGESEPEVPAGVSKSVQSSSGALPEDLFSSEPQQIKQAQQPVSSSDLLAGWNEFEALFSEGEMGKEEINPIPSRMAGVPDKVDSTEAEIPTDIKPLEESDRSITAPPPSAAKKTHGNAVQFFLAGKWQKSATNFMKAFNATATISGGSVDNFRRRCVKEYTAATLLHKASTRNLSTAARLGRHACALNLQPSLQAVCQMQAAEINISAGNYGWAGDLLSALMVQVMESNELQQLVDMQSLSDKLNSCDSVGPQNSSIGSEEDMSSFSMIIEVTQDLKDIDAIATELCNM